MEQAILDFINRVYQALGWPGVVLLMTIESACIPLPSEIIMPLAGWMLIASPGLSVWFVLLAAFCGALGNVFGSLISYVVGAKGGVPFLRRYGKYILITNHDLDRANYWFERRGDWITFIARFVPGIRTFISLPAGIARMNIPKFTFFAFLDLLSGPGPWPTRDMFWTELGKNPRRDAALRHSHNNCGCYPDCYLCLAEAEKPESLRQSCDLGYQG